MTCESPCGVFEWPEQAPITFTQWKTILSNLTKTETTQRLSSSSDPHRRSPTRKYSSSVKKNERQPLPRNQVFGDGIVDSFLVSSSSNIAQSSINIPRQDIHKLVSSPTKRYVSSFKTLVDSTNSKSPQRLSYVNDSVIILKLSKEKIDTTENTGGISQYSGKQSTLSMTTSTTLTHPTFKQSSTVSPSRLSPLLKVEGQKRRTTHHDSSSIGSGNLDLTISSNSAQIMAMGTTSHSSLFSYRNTLAGGNTVRQRTLADTNTNSLLITTERLKTNISSSIRPGRQPLAATATTMPSAYISSQSPQRNANQNTKPRVQQDKITSSKELFDYSDPFTNCPQDVLSKLAQLTKLQLETVDWERKRRYTKRKPMTNGTTQGKDSP